MLNYDDRMSNEPLKMNVQFRKIEPRKYSAQNDVTSTKSEFSQIKTKPFKKQKLSPNAINFGKFPVQKLLRIPFENWLPLSRQRKHQRNLSQKQSGRKALR